MTRRGTAGSKPHMATEATCTFTKHVDSLSRGSFFLSRQLRLAFDVRAELHSWKVRIYSTRFQCA